MLGRGRIEPAERADLEGRVRDAATRGDISAGVTMTIEGYGPELLGFLLAVHANEADANDAFSELTEGIWLGLATFAWESTHRTWVYAIARNVMRANKRKAARRERRVTPASGSAIDAVAAKVRTETLTFLKTEKRTKVQALRDALPEEDRILLVLRVDRGLAWDELARVMTEEGPGVTLEAAAVTRESARLRKRFQLVKERLREQAKREGLLE